MLILKWSDIFAELQTLKLKVGDKKVYGIPRGGQIVAGLLGQAVDTPEEADFIVDDITDSGKTAEAYRVKYLKPVFVLIDKITDPKYAGKWIVFPWEAGDPVKDVEDTVIRQLEFIGEDAKRNGLIETPRRVIKALLELTEGYKQDPGKILSKVFDQENYDEMIIVRDIEFWSLCEHHMLPFQGKATVAYIPNGKVVGLSKIARLVYCFSRRLQIQERMTDQIAHSIMEHLKPQGVAVVVNAQHTCMAMRGARNGATMTTSSVLGRFREDIATRQEFLRLISG